MKRGKIKGMVAEASDTPRGPGRPPLPPEARLQRRVTLLSIDLCQQVREISQSLGVSEAAFIRQAVEREIELAGVA